MVTLNQVVREIKRFGANHGQLNGSEFCAPDEWLDRTDNTYPALFFNYNRARKERNVWVIEFSAFVADRITPEKHNEAEVWSDTMLIAGDLLSWISRDDVEYTLQEGATLTPFTEASGDFLAGHKLDFVLRIPFVFDRCVIPAKPNSGGGFLLTEDGQYIGTEDGQKISVDTNTGRLVTVNGQNITTEDGQTITID